MKTCCIFNYPAHYNYPIYQAMGSKLSCDFYFGDTIFQNIKSFDTSELSGFKGFLKAKQLPIKSFIWHSGIFNIQLSQYDNFILSGSLSYVVNWIVIFYALLHKKRVYLWCHGLKTLPKSTFSRVINKLFFSNADLLMYNHYFLKNMIDLGCKQDRIHVIHNSLDTETQSKLYEKLKPSNVYVEHFRNSNPVVIFIGRIQQRMKVHLLIEAIDILKQRGIQVNTVLIGNKIDGENIEELIDKKGLNSQFWIYGPSYEEENNSILLYNADVCVAPGTVGLTAIHALSYGTPVITHCNFSNIGPEFEAIQAGVTGCFFEENSVQSMANAIEKWIGLNDSKRNKIRFQARKTIEEEWSVNYQIELLNRLLN